MSNNNKKKGNNNNGYQKNSNQNRGNNKNNRNHGRKDNGKDFEGDYKGASKGAPDTKRLKHFNSRPRFIGNGFTYNVDPKHNDASWSKDDSHIVEQSANYGCYLPNGKAWFSGGSDKSKWGVPTAMFCDYVPCLGTSYSNQSAMSIAGQQLFQHIRKSLNKTLVGYQFADPMIAYVAFTSLVIMHKEMIRDMSIVNSWSTENFAYPRGILEALGYNSAAIDDLIKHGANYRNEFNKMMNLASSVFIPMETDVLKKYTWMSENIWGDHDSVKAQVYGYASAGYYEFKDDPSGAYAKFNWFTYDDRRSNDQLFQSKLDNFYNCLAALRDSDSYNMVVSDLRTAYSGIDSYVFDYMPDEPTISIQHNDVMLRQFQNIRTLPRIDVVLASDGRTANERAFDVTQLPATNELKCQPQHLNLNLEDVSDAAWSAVQEVGATYVDMDMLINWSSAHPDVDEVIENLDGVVFWYHNVDAYGDDPTLYIDLLEGSFTCYVPIGFHVQVPTESGYSVLDITSWDIVDEVHPAWSSLNNFVTILSKFDWCPIIHRVTAVVNDEDEYDYFNIEVFVEDEVLGTFDRFRANQMNQGRQFAYWRVDNNMTIG